MNFDLSAIITRTDTAWLNPINVWISMVPSIIKSPITSVIDFDSALNGQSRRSHRDYNAIYNRKIDCYITRNLVRGIKREIISELSSPGIILSCPLQRLSPHHRSLWLLQFSGLRYVLFRGGVSADGNRPSRVGRVMGLMRDSWIRGSLIARFREDFVEGLVRYSGIANDSSRECFTTEAHSGTLLTGNKRNL